MILSGQSIRRRGVFTPFSERALHADSGMSYGLGPATYDVRLRDALVLEPGEFKLAVTLEHVSIPHDLSVTVMDKSTLARRGIAVQHTHIDPGFRGHVTLEITNHGYQVLELAAGAPIAQFKFEMLDEPAEAPYRGKYQDAGPWPQNPLREE